MVTSAGLGESIKVGFSVALATGTVDSVESCFALTVSIDQLFIVTANDVAFTGLRNKVEESSSWTGSANTVLLVIFSLANTFSIDKDFVSSTSPNTSLETGIVSVTVYGVTSSANSVDDVSFGGADTSFVLQVVDFIQFASWSANLKRNFVNLIIAALVAYPIDQVKAFAANVYLFHQKVDYFGCADWKAVLDLGCIR